MDVSFVFSRNARTWRTGLILIAVYAALLAAILWLDAALWLMALLALPTLPALADLWRNPSAGVTLDARQLDWHSGARHATLHLNEIDHMRFDTRFDFSVRVMAVLTSGKRIRLPDESLPPHKTFEAELTARDVRVERHHFVVF